MTSKNFSFYSVLFRRFNGLILLNIFGLALGLASIVFISVWIKYELDYDSFSPKSKRICRIESLFDYSGDKTVWSITPSPLAEAVKNDFPEVVDAVRLATGRQSGLKKDDDLFFAYNLYYTSHSFFNIFEPKIVKGDPAVLLSGPDEIVLSESTSKTLFGNTDPVGRTLLLNNSDLLTITGVMQDFPLNSHIRPDYLVSFSVLENSGEDLVNWGRFDFLTYVLLKDNADAESFNKKISGYLQTKVPDISASLFINPLTRLYLYRDPGFKSFVYPSSDKGPIKKVLLFAIIGIVLLTIACINFINLSTAFAAQRAKEIGIRKVNGASRINLILSLFGESLLQTLMAAAFAFVIVIVTLPIFNKVADLNMGLESIFSLNNLAVYFILILITGFIAGLYPAMILSSFSPVKVIKPLPEDKMQGSGLRKILVVIQFTLSIIFIFCVLVMKRQVFYMQSLNLGFNTENVMAITPRTSHEKIDAISKEIEKIPGIEKVAIGGNIPVNMGNFNTLSKWDGNVSGKPLMFYMVQVDDRYLDLLDIKLVEGKYFNTTSEGTEVIVNETAVRKMDMDDPLGKSIWLHDERYQIIGVAKDFNFHNLKEEVRPVFIYKNKNWWMKIIFVNLQPGNHFQVVDKIIETVKKIAPGFPVHYLFLDEEIRQYYDNERKLNLLINTATVLSIVISCIGLFSLTAFTVQKKNREIGIRKAYGATSLSVLFMLHKDFSRLILISSVIALPAGYFVIKKWLQSYAFHISVKPYFFLIPILIIFVVAYLTLIFNTLKAVNLNPAEALRNE